MTSAKCWDFLPPLLPEIRNQLILFLLSAFWGPLSPLSMRTTYMKAHVQKINYKKWPLLRASSPPGKINFHWTNLRTLHNHEFMMHCTIDILMYPISTPQHPVPTPTTTLRTRPTTQRSPPATSSWTAAGRAATWPTPPRTRFSPRSPLSLIRLLRHVSLATLGSVQQSRPVVFSFS